jgi:hypothetical protein
MAGHALRAAAERCDRTLADLVGGQRGDKREAATLFRNATARRFRSRSRNAGRAHAAARRPAIIIVGLRRNHARALRTRGFFLAEALLGDFVSLALGLLIVPAALFLGALARLGGLTLGTLDRVALRADLRLFLGNLATFASPSACARRLCSSSVSVRSTTPDAFGADAAGVGAGAAGAGAGAPRATTPTRRGVEIGAAGACSAGFASPGSVRLRTFSTTTALERPWLKL